MNKHLLRRRQLLLYFGLAAGGTALSSCLSKAATPRTATRFRPTPVSEAATPKEPSLPEFQGISQWLNSAPVQVAQLKGNVVLVQFWTLGCINCLRTLPYITRWHGQYANQGLKVVGVHTPEFPYEREVENVKKALKQHQITYAVPLDNEYKTWEAYENGYWPHLFIADRQGFLRYDHIGEGAYEETEQMIRTLLG